MHFDLAEILRGISTGVGQFALLAVIFAIVFAESGLFVGFFLPGDSLLFTAGFLASQGYVDIGALLFVCFVSAVLGDNVGYVFGHKVGAKLFNRPNSRLFKKDHLLKAQKFYEKHGPKTILLARFTPIIRTFAPIVAGAANMHYSTFVKYNLLGGLIWGIGMPLLGYILGKSIPAETIDKFLFPVIIVIIVVSLLPGVIHYIKEKGYLKDLKILKKSSE